MWLAIAGLSFSANGQDANLTLEVQPAPQVTEPVNNTRLVKLSGNTVGFAQPALDQGIVPSDFELSRMFLVLKRSPAQESALAFLVKSQQDPHSPNYHKWLTPESFGAKFGVAQEDIDKITAWLRSNGFVVAGASKARTTIEFSGKHSQIQAAFHTTLHRYQVGGQLHMANATDPEIPEAFKGVIAGVNKLNDSQKKSFSHLIGKHAHSTAFPGPSPSYNRESSHYLSPGDYWTIYNATPTIEDEITGQGITIGIVGRSDILASDVASFRSSFLGSSYTGTFQQIINGLDPGDVSGDDVENTLDVEWSTALAPGASVVLVVSPSTVSDGVDLSAEYLIDNNLADVVSVSYGLCEELMGSAENQFFGDLWEQAAAQGTTVVVASGDGGSAGCDADTAPAAAYGLQVNGIASTPFNVAVGGTEFNDGSDAWSPTTGSSPLPGTSAIAYIPEEVWNESESSGTLYGGGGGVSNCTAMDIPFDVTGCSGGWPKPDWQKGVYGIPNDEARDLPDVSLTAAIHDGYLIEFQGGLGAIGGTSCAAPSFAGVMALVNQKMATRQGQANYMLYQLGSNEFGGNDSPNAANLSACNSTAQPATGNTCAFYDVTAGSNAVPCEGGTLDCSASGAGTTGLLTGFAADSGFDLASGIGSINISNLVQAWYAATPHGTAPTSTTISASPSSGSVHGAPVQISGNVTPKSGSGTPGGSAIVTANGVSIASVPVTNESYSAVLNNLPGGNIQILTRYSGDSAFAASKSPAISFTITKEASITTVSVTARDAQTGIALPIGAIPYGSNVIVSGLAASASGQGIPTGSMSLNVASSSYPVVLNNAGQASYTITSLTAGSYSVEGQYAGDASFTSSSSSSPAPFTVVQGNTAISLAAGSQGSGGTSVSVSVLADSFGAAPSGLAQFYVNGNSVGTAAIQEVSMNGSGTTSGATFVVSASLMSVGANSVTAQYLGDTNYLPSALSAPLTVNAQKVTLTSPTQPVATVSAQELKPGIILPISVTVLGSFQSLNVQWAPGTNPVSGWSSQGITLNGSISPPVTSQAVANWDTSVITAAGYYTIQVSAVNQGTTSTGSALVYFEPALVSSNWPKWLDGDVEYAGYNSIVPAVSSSGSTSLVVAQLNGQHTPAQILDFTADGSSVSTLPISWAGFFRPAIGNLDLSPGDEIVMPDGDLVHVFYPDGTKSDRSYSVSGIPVFFASQQPLLEDVDGDSLLETVTFGDGADGQGGWSGTGYLFAWRNDGTLLNQNFPVIIPDQNNFIRNYSVPRVLVGDVAGVGSKDFVVIEGTNPSSFTPRLFGADGTPQNWNSPTIVGEPVQMALADLDHNGKLETIILTYDQFVHVLQPDGSERAGWPVNLYPFGTLAWGSLAVGDLNRDGREEIVVSAGNLFVLNADGTEFSSAWPTHAGSNIYGSAVLADVNGDGYPEIVTTLGINNYVSGTPDSAQLLVFDRFGNVLTSWALPGAPNEKPWIGDVFFPTVGDFTGGGTAQIAVLYTTISLANKITQHFIATLLDTGAPLNPAANDWPMLYQNARSSAVRRNVGNSIVSLAAAANPSTSGAGTFFTLSVSDPSSSGTTPTGVANLLDGSRNIGSCNLVSGTCTIVPSLSQGTHRLVTGYVGDMNFANSLSAPLSQVVKRPGTATTTLVTVLPSSVQLGGSINLAASVTSSPAGTPGGTVTFAIAGSQLGSAALSGAVAAVNNMLVSAANGFTVGSNSITATYSGDGSYAASGDSTTLTVTNPAAVPVFNPAQGTYTSTQTVSISDSTPGEAIYYTINGTTPTTGSTLYTAPITVSASETIEAIATASGFSQSAVTAAVYTITPPAAAPVFSPAQGTYTSTQSVSISDSTPGEAIYFTTNGTTPNTGSTLYSGPVSVSSSETIEAIAVASGYSSSTVATSVYTITPPAAAPVFSPAQGTYTSTQTVSISDPTPGEAIYYTTNNTTPTTSSTLCNGPISVATTETIEAIAVASGYSSSAVATSVYTITPPAAAPVFSPAQGTYTSTQSVSISDSTPGEAIYYTTNNTTPTTGSTLYAGPITVSASETIEAIAIASGYSTSSTASAVYTITPPAAAPVFNPAQGTYTSTQSVSISDSTPGEAIYYTTNNTTPTTGSTLYAGPITVSSSETIQAIAIASGYSSSAVSSSVYTITPPAAVPVFNPTQGTFTSTQTVSISDSTPGEEIYYTTNNTTPTTSSTLYSGPITVSSSETIQAIAIASGYSTSSMASSVYTITPPAAAPVMGSISPAFTNAGGATFTLTITGSGFTSNAVVYWGATALTTQFVGTTEVTAQVPATDIANTGVTVIAVETPAPAANVSNSLQFEVDSISGSTSSPTFTTSAATVASGSTANYPVTLPTSATNVSASCLNLPTSATCSYSSGTGAVTISTTTETSSGTYQVTVVFAETMSGTSSALILMPILMLPLVAIRKKWHARRIWLLACLGIALTAGVVVGCGGSGSVSTTPPSTHQVTSSGIVSITVQ